MTPCTTPPIIFGQPAGNSEMATQLIIQAILNDHPVDDLVRWEQTRNQMRKTEKAAAAVAETAKLLTRLQEGRP